MSSEWDDEGEFESVANLSVADADLSTKDPFDLSRALEGAALEHLHPDKKRFILHSEFEPSGDQPKAIENLISQLENSQERCVLSCESVSYTHLTLPTSNGV